MKYSPIMAVIAMLFIATHSSAQNVILVNGQASEVTLDGDVITSVINTNLNGYMSDFESAVSDRFSKKPLHIETPGIVLDKHLLASEFAGDEAYRSTLFRLVE